MRVSEKREKGRSVIDETLLLGLRARIHSIRTYIHGTNKRVSFTVACVYMHKNEHTAKMEKDRGKVRRLRVSSLTWRLLLYHVVYDGVTSTALNVPPSLQSKDSNQHTETPIRSRVS